MRLCVTAKSGADVRFGSKADMNRSNRDVRFTPKSGHCQQRFYEYTPEFDASCG
jgi:hypothetical protein